MLRHSPNHGTQPSSDDDDDDDDDDDLNKPLSVIALCQSVTSTNSRCVL